MPRTQAIFEVCFQLASTAFNRPFELTFHAVSDADVMPADVLQSRSVKEAESLKVPALCKSIYSAKDNLPYLTM